jgi:hypothetical protein
MRLFACQHCGQPLFFENTRCQRCGHSLGYLPERGVLAALDPAGGDAWRAQGFGDRGGGAGGGLNRFCANAAFDACNWLVAADSADRFCRACRHNRIIPSVDDAENLARWRTLESAKHRLFYSLLRLNLPLATRREDPAHGLAFDFLADAHGAATPIMTGHKAGIITVALAEADAAMREARRQQMGETYRTLLGHFRHEIGHYFWDVLVQRDASRLAAFRNLFGDERADYAAALKAHYENGPQPGWQERHISAYASSHPLEDFAESWAHYLHIVDALETASAFGLRIHPQVTGAAGFHGDADFDPYEAATAAVLVESWMPLTFAINSMNRSLGQPDLYPFVLTPPAIEKLGFVHALVRRDEAF